MNINAINYILCQCTNKQIEIIKMFAEVGRIKALKDDPDCHFLQMIGVLSEACPFVLLECDECLYYLTAFGKKVLNAITAATGNWN